MREDLRPPAPAAETAPDLDRRPDARGRRAPARHRAQLRPLARAGDEEASDPARPDDREHVLRVLDAHVLQLRARREAALGGHDLDQGRRLVGGQGRVAQGHGAHARRVRPGRDRHPAPAHRRAAADHGVHERAHRQRRRRKAPASDPGAARPLHHPGGGREDRRPPCRDRRRRPALARRALEHPGADADGRAGHAGRAPVADAARDRGDGVRGLHGHPLDRRGRRRLHPAHAARADAGGRELRARACASTRRAGASRRSGSGPGRRSCIRVR